MGLNIGQIPNALGNATFPRDVIDGNRSSNQGRIGFGEEAQKSQGPFFRDKPAAGPQIGFGQGTISGPALALKTINRGVQAARQAVPSIPEIRAEQRAKFARMRDETELRARERDTQRVDIRLPDAASNARDFINRLNETAGAIQARIGGQDLPEAAPQATFEIRGEAFTFGTRRNDTQVFTFTNPAGAPRIDILV